MARHSKGKHSKPKAALKHQKNQEEQAQVATETAATDDNNKAPAGAHAASATGDTAAMPALQNGTSGAHAQPEQNAFMSEADQLADKKARRKKIAKRAGIISGSVIGGLAAIYLIGVAIFATHFMPNTHISTMDVSFKTPEEVQHDFDTKVGDYSFRVKGKGMNISITSEQAGINIDSVKMTNTITDGQNPWEWPVEIFYDHDVTPAMTDSLSANTLSDVVKAAVEEVNAKGYDPTNAYCAYDENTGKFEIIPEVKGTKLNYEAVLADILIGAMSLEDEVIITGKDLIPPTVLEDDKRLIAVTNDANTLISAEVQLLLGGTPVMMVDGKTIQNWVAITPEFQAVIDDGAMTDWANGVADQFNTVGSTRNFTRPDGKQIEVSGGDYGWKIDSDSLASSLVEAVRNKTKGNIDVPVTQSGTGFTTLGGQDWGNRWISVDISQQHARFYDGNDIIWEADIVSGATSGGRATPPGVYDLNFKGRHVTLTGRDSAGNITYETPVAYWMPFIKNSIGFHDATWQSAFGGNRYRTGHGSHGCINLSLSNAEALYGLIELGDVVVVHY